MKRVIGLTWSRSGYLESGSVPKLYQQIHHALEARATVKNLDPMLGLAAEQQRLEYWRQFFKDCDVVVTSCVFGGEPLRRRAQLGLRTPLLYLPLGDLPRGASGLRSYLDLFHSGDVIACSCTADEAILRSLVKECPAQLSLLPFGVNQDRFAPGTKAERLAARKVAGIGVKPCLITYVGRVTAQKNVLGLIRAAIPVLESCPSAELVIAGPVEDDYFSEFKSGPYALEPLLGKPLHGHAGLEGRVHLLPSLNAEHCSALLKASDIFANLTLHGDENFGFTQVEAMAAGLPVVGTRWGGLKDTLKDGVTGLTVDTCLFEGGVWADLHQASQALSRLVKDRELRRRLGAAGRARVLELYSEDVFARNLWSAVQKCRRSGPAKPVRPSALGRAYNRAFLSQPFKIKGRRWWGKGSVSYDATTYPLYRALLAPYVSRTSAGAPTSGDTLFIGPLNVRVAPRAQMIDPLWPRTVRLNVRETRVLGKLQALCIRRGQTFLPLEALKLSGAEELAALASLCDKGFVFRSPAPAEPP